MLNLGMLSDLGCGCSSALMHGLGGLDGLDGLGLGELGALHAQTAAQRRAAAEEARLARQREAEAKRQAADEARRQKAAAAAAEKLLKSKLADFNKLINQIKPHMTVLQADPAGQPWIVYYNCLQQSVAQLNAGQPVQTCTGPSGTVAQAVKTINDIKRDAQQKQRQLEQQAKHEAQQTKQADRKKEAAEAKQKRIETAAQKKIDQQQKRDDRKEARKKKRVAGRDVSVLPGKEEQIADGANAEATAFINQAKAAIAAGKSARTPEQKKQAAKMASDALAMIGKAINPAVITQIGKPKASNLVRQTKQVARKGVRGFDGYLGYIDPVTGVENGLPDPNAPANLIDGGSSGFPTGGTDPVTQMLMTQMMQPPSLPAQCAKRPNSQLCQIAKMSADSQKQMGFLITMVMQMQQQLMGMLQELLAGGGTDQFYPPPTDPNLYPPVDPNMYPGGGYPPPSASPYPESYPPPDAGYVPGIPTGGAMAPGGVDAIPPGFDAGSAPDFMPADAGGGDFIPQDISLSTGGAFAQPQFVPQTYAPAESFTEQPQFVSPDMPYAPESGYIPPQVFADEGLPEAEEVIPQYQQAQLPSAAGIPQEISAEELVGMENIPPEARLPLEQQQPVEMAAAGMLPGPSQAQIQDMYFEDQGRDDGF